MLSDFSFDDYLDILINDLYDCIHDIFTVRPRLRWNARPKTQRRKDQILTLPARLVFPLKFYLFCSRLLFYLHYTVICN